MAIGRRSFSSEVSPSAGLIVSESANKPRALCSHKILATPGRIQKVGLPILKSNSLVYRTKGESTFWIRPGVSVLANGEQPYLERALQNPGKTQPGVKRSFSSGVEGEGSLDKGYVRPMIGYEGMVY